MKEKKEMSVQAGLGMLAQGLSAIFPDKGKDTRTVTMPFSEYEKLVNEASNTHKDAKIKEMQSEIHELNREIFDWQTRCAKFEIRVHELVNENESLKNTVKCLEQEVLCLNEKKHKWWQIWKR